MRAIILFIIMVTIIGCNSHESNQFRFKIKEKEDITINNYKCYQDEYSRVYVDLMSASKISDIKNGTVVSVSLDVTDTIFNGKPIKTAFSRETKHEPFMYFVGFKSNKLIFIEADNKNLFYIGKVNDLKHLIENNYITIEKNIIEVP